MVEIEFNFEHRLTVIQANLDDTFQDVFNKYFQKWKDHFELNNDIDISEYLK